MRRRLRTDRTYFNLTRILNTSPKQGALPEVSSPFKFRWNEQPELDGES